MKFIMNTKKIAIVVTVSLATSMSVLASDTLDGVSLETELAVRNAAADLASCTTAKTCRAAGLKFGEMSARMSDEHTVHVAKEAWHKGAISAVKAMHKSGAISDVQELQALMHLTKHAFENGVSVDITKE